MRILHEVLLTHMDFTSVSAKTPFHSESIATFSIVAGGETGDLGVGVASRYFAVGSSVPWAEAGVGAVATQANVNVGYGARALELLKEGRTAPEVLNKILAEDKFEGKEGRQVAIIDAKGNTAAYTGPAAQAWAGHRAGKTWSVQGNILVGPQVLEAMGRAFERSDGELSERLYAALRAGDAEGGDSRGRQSAALVVVRKQGGRNINNDRYVWINVDDSPDPLGELRRLLNLNLAYINQNRASECFVMGQLQQACEFANRATHLAPSKSDIRIYSAFLHYLAGDRVRALKEFRDASAADPNFKQLWDATLHFRQQFRVVGEDADLVQKIFG